MGLAEQYVGGEKVRVDEVVYCLSHGGVHADTLDPYDEGIRSCLLDYDGPDIVGRKAVHRPVYWGAHKGDYREDK